MELLSRPELLGAVPGQHLVAVGKMSPTEGRISPKLHSAAVATIRQSSRIVHITSTDEAKAWLLETKEEDSILRQCRHLWSAVLVPNKCVDHDGSNLGAGMFTSDFIAIGQVLTRRYWPNLEDWFLNMSGSRRDEVFARHLKRCKFPTDPNNKTCLKTPDRQVPIAQEYDTRQLPSLIKLYFRADATFKSAASSWGVLLVLHLIQSARKLEKL